MDEMVAAAMAKWPAVPRCRGWLGLDARGTWRLRDEAAQAAGAFDVSRGEPIGNERLRDFIGRNYQCDDTGCWYVQNGPQRVDVELEAAPWVWRLSADEPVPSVTSHTGRAVTPVGVWLDENGRVFLHTDAGHGLVHSMDTGLAAAAIDRGLWAVQTLPFAAMPERFRYCLSPAALDAMPDRAESYLAAPTM